LFRKPPLLMGIAVVTTVGIATQAVVVVVIVVCVMWRVVVVVQMIEVASIFSGDGVGTGALGFGWSGIVSSGWFG
jgi:hypothetical protein